MGAATDLETVGLLEVYDRVRYDPLNVAHIRKSLRTFILRSFSFSAGPIPEIAKVEVSQGSRGYYNFFSRMCYSWATFM